MKRCIFLLISLTLVVFSLSAAETGWEWDAEKADSLFYSGDYDSAWLFYERAMNTGADDAKVLFRAAESFDKQQLSENPEFGEALYTVSHYLMQTQYPDDPALSLTEVKANPDVVVNRRYIRTTFGMIGAKAPKTRRDISLGFGGKIINYCIVKVEDLGTFFVILLSEGVRASLDWSRGRLWNLLTGYLIISLIPGVILPVVMAITVAREGRKSYVSAYAFLIYWGPLGIHRFYMGRHISGIIWLLTGGLAGIGLFFDIFLTGAYIRFWNEDHRSGRPSGEAGGSIGSGVSRRVKSPKPVKAPRDKKIKPEKVKAPKPPRIKKEKKVNDTDDMPDITAGVGAAVVAASVNDEEGFSFDMASDEDDEFGDLPDLNIDGDDFDIPTADDGGTDEFDLGSLD